MPFSLRPLRLAAALAWACCGRRASTPHPRKAISTAYLSPLLLYGCRESSLCLSLPALSVPPSSICLSCDEDAHEQALISAYRVASRRAATSFRYTRMPRGDNVGVCAVLRKTSGGRRRGIGRLISARVSLPSNLVAARADGVVVGPLCRGWAFFVRCRGHLDVGARTLVAPACSLASCGGLLIARRRKAPGVAFLFFARGWIIRPTHREKACLGNRPAGHRMVKRRWRHHPAA